jgi:uncharacterized protein involved in exopolysaccharide biosynthesis/Mrp family chromosome partitioning ATPase
MDLIYLFNSLMKRKWLILTGTILAAVAAFFLTFRQEKLYKSVAQIATGFTNSDQVKLKDESFNIYEIDTKFNNLIEALKSPKVLGMTGYNVMLHDLQDPAKSFRRLNAEEKKSDVYRNLNKAKAIERLTSKYNDQKLLSSYDPEDRKILELLKLYKYDLETFRSILFVDRVQRTDFIDIKYRSVNPELSAYIVNQICTEFLRNYETSRNQQTVQNIESLQKLVDKKRVELDEKINNLKLMGTMDASMESSSKLDQIGNFETRLVDEKSILTSATLALQQINIRLADNERTTSQSTAAASSMNNELASIRKQMNDTYADYTASGSSNTELYNKYQKLKSQYKDKLVAMASSTPAAGTSAGASKTDLLQKKSDLEIQIKGAEQNIATYQQKIRELNTGINAVASRSANNLALQKEVELAQQEYESIKSRYDAANNSRIAPMESFRQILYGQPAVEPEPSKRFIIVALAGMSMFVFCCIAIIFFEYIDVSIKTPSNFQRSTDMKLLGIVNHINLHKNSLETIFAEVPSKKNNNSTFRELLRKLRYEMINSNKKIFLFTSNRSGEGKSTIIKALAHSLSLSHKRILIIDTHFPHNTLTKDFNAEGVLEEFNSNDTPLTEEKLRELITTTDIPNVDIIGSTGGEYTPSEVLRNGNLLASLREISTHYDYIMLEGAPLNERSDTKELMKYADTVIIVSSAKSSIKQTDKEVISFLNSLNGKFGGAVLNFVESENINI